MRILQALPWYFPEGLGGTEIYVAALAGWLKARGHEPWVAAPLAGLVEPREYVHEGINVFRYPIPTAPTRDETQEFVRTRGTECFDRHLSRIRPEIVHFHTLGTGLGLGELRQARGMGSKVFFTTHASSLGFTCQRGSLMRWGTEVCDGIVRTTDCAACALQHRGLSQTAAGLLGRLPPGLSGAFLRVEGRLATALALPALIERNRAKQQELYDLVDRVVVLTQWAKDILIRNGAPPGKILLNRLGISSPPARSTRSASNSPVRIGYLGRFEDVKGVLDLARAVARVPRTISFDMEFRGPVRTAEEKRLLGQMKQILQGDPRVHFEPGVTPGEVSTILASYDVLCCPSLCLEGGPTVALEAMAAGTPVLGTRIGGLAEIVDHDINGWLVPPGDITALSDALARIGQEATSILPRWRAGLGPIRTMDQIASDYLALYQGDKSRA